MGRLDAAREDTSRRRCRSTAGMKTTTMNTYRGHMSRWGCDGELGIFACRRTGNGRGLKE